jgi:hypothetical protein
MRTTFRDGLDPVGPFHPYLVFGAVLLLDLALAGTIITFLLWACDRLEDILFPGGTEWLPF